MIRKLWAIGAVILFLIFAFDKWILSIVDMIVDLPRAGRQTINFFSEIEYWLLNHDIHLLPLALAVVVILSGWIIPDVWPHISRKIFGHVPLEVL